MPRRATVIRLSSKGQLVIPAALRRQLGLKTGQDLAARTGTGHEIILSPVAVAADSVDMMLRRCRSWAGSRQRDLVDELHQRRRHDRVREGHG